MTDIVRQRPKSCHSPNVERAIWFSLIALFAPEKARVKQKIGIFRVTPAARSIGWLGPTRVDILPSKRGLLPSVRALLDYLGARFSELRED